LRFLIPTVNNPEEEAGGYDTNSQRNIGAEMQQDLEIGSANNYNQSKDDA